MLYGHVLQNMFRDHCPLGVSNARIGPLKISSEKLGLRAGVGVYSSCPYYPRFIFSLNLKLWLF
jgi:hypothetical protein